MEILNVERNKGNMKGKTYISQYNKDCLLKVQEHERTLYYICIRPCEYITPFKQIRPSYLILNRYCYSQMIDDRSILFWLLSQS